VLDADDDISGAGIISATVVTAVATAIVIVIPLRRTVVAV
jgi:hypothetical protein